MHNSSVKWGHLRNFDPNSTNAISLPTLWGHLGHFELGSTKIITKTKIRTKMPLKFLLYLFSRHQLTIKVIIIMKNRA